MAAVQLRQHQAEAREGLSLFILDSILIGSLRFVLDKVAAAAEREMHDDTALREQLLEAQMRLELGEISEKEFAAIERDLLGRLRQITRPHREPIRSRVRGVEVETWKPEP